MNQTPTERYWRFPTWLMRDLTSMAILSWLGFTLVVIGIIVAVDRYGHLDRSIWEEASQIPQWFVLFIGVHLSMTYLPLSISHGRTRRDAAIEATLFMAAFSGLVAVLLTLSWGIERVAFSILDVKQVLSDPHIFDSATNYPLIFLESWIVLLIWVIGGAFIAASYYRYDGPGLLAIAPALLISSVTEFAMGASWGPTGQFLQWLGDPNDPPLLVTMLVAVAGAAIMLAMIWRIVRDIPLRKPSV